MTNRIRVAIMQPYFLPYIGYWQLMHNADIFVLYDNIQYTKKGWINRNKFLLDDQPQTFSLPLKKSHDLVHIRDRQLANTFNSEKEKLLRRWEAAYRKAPHFEEVWFLLNDILADQERNLFGFIFNSIKKVRSYLQIDSKLIISSTLEVPEELKGQERVLATCKAVGANQYINPIGGIDLYNEQRFSAEGIQLLFHRARPISYRQHWGAFVPSLSILDVLMFLGAEETKKLLNEMDAIIPCKARA